MEFKKYLLSEISDYKTGRLNSNAAIENGKYKFFTCAPNPLTINSYSYDDDVILLAGNNANGIFHINRFNGKFDAYQRTYIIKPKFDVIDIDYLYYYLKFKLNFLRSQSIGSATKYLTKPILDNLEIYSPKSKRKETIISSILKILDKKIELNKRIIANLEELSQTLFKRWFVDFEFPDENGNPYKSSGGEMIDSELGEIPSGWKVDELGNYIKIKSGKRPKNKVDKKDIENVVPIIGASKIMGYTNDYLYNEKIIIIGRVGTHGVIQRFSTRTWPSDNTFVIISDFESIIYQVLKSIDYISLNRGSTQPLLSQKDIKNTKVAMPTNETLLSTYQKENNHILKMMDQKKYRKPKTNTIKRYFTTKINVGGNRDT